MRTGPVSTEKNVAGLSLVSSHRIITGCSRCNNLADTPEIFLVFIGDADGLYFAALPLWEEMDSNNPLPGPVAAVERQLGRT